MILLTSDGITSGQLLERIRKALPHITEKAALVVTASNFHKELDDNVPVLTEQMADCGLESRCVDVEFEDAGCLLSYDAVILMGGNPFYLRRHLMKWPRAKEILQELGRSRVLVGISAGSMVLGNTMEFVCPIEQEGIAQTGKDVDCDGFGIVPLNIFPHYKAYLTVYPGVDRLLESYQEETGNELQTINDGEGICIRKPGSSPVYIRNERYTPRVSGSRDRLQCDNYLFDVYGTMIDIHTDEDKEELWKQMARYYAYRGAMYDPKEMKQCYVRMIQEEYDNALQLLGEGRFPEPQVETVFERMYQEKGVAVTAAEARAAAQMFRSLSLEYIRLYYGVKQLLEHLKRRGKKLYVLSNAQQVFTEAELRYLGIYDYFDKVFLSSDCGCKKPDAGFFGRLLDGEGLQPENTMMIGNSAHDDIIPARALGLATCYICSNLSDEEDRPACDIYLKTMDMPLLESILCGEE